MSTSNGSRTSSRSGRVRPVDVARLGLGGLALLRPAWLLRGTGSRDGVWPRRVTRILGARYVVQSAGGVLLPDRRVPRLDGAVDLVHAASTLGFAAAFPDHRRLAFTSGALALGFAYADLTETGDERPSSSSTGHGATEVGR